MKSSARASGDFVGEKVPVLDPAEVRVRLNEQGQVELRLPDDTVRRGVLIVPAFPISRPNRFVYFRDEEGKELGLLIDPKRLDRESREIVEAQTDQAYFMPRITRIARVEERMGIARWEVETDRGWSSFDVVSRSESVWFVGRSRVVIRDADGNRYLIENLNALDRRSRRLAELHL
ncbi:MAG: DUF1854 domain-containing protein [Armatimonadota bacterium]|nr:MAG: DUF1854 domain-containing protein [Armatimonadota bacterium]